MKHMKTFFQVTMVALAIVAFSSCGTKENEAVRHFAAQVSYAIAENDTALLAKLYPNAMKIDSLIAPDTTDISVVALGDSAYTVTYGNDSIYLNVSTSIDSQYVVNESHGLLGIPNNVNGVALKTGWIDPKLNDVENGERLEDKEFLSYIENIWKDSLNKALTAKGGKSSGGPDESLPVSIKVHNNTNKTIKASDYKLFVQGSSVSYYMKWGEEYKVDGYKTSKTMPGKEIAPNGSVVFVYNVPTLGSIVGDYARATGTVVWDKSILEEARNNYKFKGTEYDDYLKTIGGKKSNEGELDTEKCISFITKMYNSRQFESNSFIANKCTKRMKKKLRAANEYDDGGYATWLFRSDAEDGPSNVSKIISVIPLGDGWFKYTFYDMGVKGANKIKLIEYNGKIMVDNLKKAS